MKYDVLQLLARTKLEPRPYQSRLIKRTINGYLPQEEGGKGWRAVLIESPTGSGKTCVALTVCKAMQEIYQDLGICWISQRRNLLGQAERENANKGINAGIYFASMFAKELPAEFLEKPKRMVVCDEAQHDACNSAMHLHAMAKADFILGMSVGGDSTVLVKDDDGHVKHTTISDFIDNTITTPDDKITYVTGWSVRAFNGTSFVWKKLKSVIRHRPGDKRTYRIYTKKGRSILVTEDHSLYKVVSNSLTRTRDDGSSITGPPKPIASLQEVRGSDLAVGDWLLMEDKLPAIGDVRELDITKTIVGNRWNVAGDFDDYVCDQIIEENGYKDAHKVRYQRRHGKYGTYLSAIEFNSLNNDRRRGLVYFAGNGNYCHSHIPLDKMAYLIGFYLGNGWTDNNRVIFSANHKQLPILEKVLENLQSHAKFTIDKKELDGSTEVRINSKILSDWFNATIGGRAWDKSIPDLCFSMSIDNIRLVLGGMLDTDGCQCFSAQQRNRWYYTTTSKKLANGICELLKFVGVVAGINRRSHLSGGEVNGRQIVGRHTAYTINFSGHAYSGYNTGTVGQRQHFVMGDISGYPVQITKIVQENAEYVYDFSVDDNDWQTFVANGFLVHNTATPYRTDRMKLCFDTILHDSGLGTLIRDGWLAQYEHYSIPSWKVEDVCHTYLNSPDHWGRSIMYFHTVMQCMQARDILQANGINCDVVTGDTDRDSQIAELQAGTMKVLINCMVLTEGMDVPALQTAFCKPSCKGVTVQMAGRVFRKHPDVPIKRIVQCERTKWPFVKTAEPACSYKWELPKDGNPGEWLSLTINPYINEMNCKMLVTLASIDTELPDFMKKKLESKRGRMKKKRFV